MYAEFETQAYAKWLMTGEHAVIRGCPAIVFPLKEQWIKLQYFPSQKLSVQCDGYAKVQIESSLPALLREAFSFIDADYEAFSGIINIENKIPSGGGLGLSAALSVIVTRLLKHAYPDQISSVFTFAKQLEDLFHEKSSGVDIVGSMSELGQYYKLGAEPQAIHLKQHYHLSLHYSEISSQTKGCVQHVYQLWEHDPKRAQEIDNKMALATQLAHNALLNNNHHSGLLQLKESFEIAENCFKDWGLISAELEAKIQSLKTQGALAVKPTGSGNGGYLLALWEHELPSVDECIKIEW